MQHISGSVSWAGVPPSPPHPSTGRKCAACYLLVLCVCLAACSLLVLCVCVFAVSGPNMLFLRKLFLTMVIDPLGLAFSTAEMRACWRSDIKLCVLQVASHCLACTVLRSCFKFPVPNGERLFLARASFLRCQWCGVIELQRSCSDAAGAALVLSCPEHLLDGSE